MRDSLNDLLPTMVGSLIVLTLVVVLIWYKNRQLSKQGKNWADYINNEILEGHAVIAILLIIVINLAEAMVAASIPEKGGAYQLNPIARFIAHSAINAVAAVMMITSPLQFIKALGATSSAIGYRGKGQTKQLLIGSAFMQLVIFVALMSVALYLPYLNYQVIAAGLDELFFAKLAFFQTFGIDIRPTLKAAGYSIDTNPLSELTYTMIASYALILVHYVVSFVDGLYAAGKFLEAQIEAKQLESKKAYVKDKVHSAPASDKEIADIKSSPVNVINYLLRQIGVNDNGVRKQKTESLHKMYADDMTTQQQVNCATELARLRSAYDKLHKNKNTLPLRTFNSERTRLNTKTKDFFRRSLADGGFQFTV